MILIHVIFAKTLEGTYPLGLGQLRVAPVYGASTLNTIWPLPRMWLLYFM